MKMNNKNKFDQIRLLDPYVYGFTNNLTSTSSFRIGKDVFPLCRMTPLKEHCMASSIIIGDRGNYWYANNASRRSVVSVAYAAFARMLVISPCNLQLGERHDIQGAGAKRKCSPLERHLCHSIIPYGLRTAN